MLPTREYNWEICIYIYVCSIDMASLDCRSCGASLNNFASEIWAYVLTRICACVTHNSYIMQSRPNRYWQLVTLYPMWLTHWGRHLPDDIFKWIFLNENAWISINISLKFIPRGPINNIPTLVQVMAWRRPGDKPLSEPMMVRLPTHICVARPQWVNCQTQQAMVYTARKRGGTFITLWLDNSQLCITQMSIYKVSITSCLEINSRTISIVHRCE